MGRAASKNEVSELIEHLLTEAPNDVPSQLFADIQDDAASRALSQQQPIEYQRRPKTIYDEVRSYF